MTDACSPSPARSGAPDFGVHPRWRSTDTVVLEVVGEVDLLTASSLLEAARDEFDGGCRSLVLDLAGVSFCSARCIGTLVEIRQLAQGQGATVRFAHPSHEVRRIADRTLFRDVIDADAPLDARPAPAGSSFRRRSEPADVAVAGPWGHGWLELATAIGPSSARAMARWRTGVRGRLRGHPARTPGRG